MKTKVWYRIVDLGDGSSSVGLYPTKELAWEGLDEDGFDSFGEIPCQVDYTEINLEDFANEA